jgi:hypothetical protein
MLLQLRLTRSRIPSLKNINGDVIDGIAHSHHDLCFMDGAFQAKVTRFPGAFEGEGFNEGDDPQSLCIEEFERPLLPHKYYHWSHRSAFGFTLGRRKNWCSPALLELTSTVSFKAGKGKR